VCGGGRATELRWGRPLGVLPWRGGGRQAGAARREVAVLEVA
jgi:hypothetical protein